MHPETKPDGDVRITETITVNAAGPVSAGQDIRVALAPLGQGEAAPRYESLADGVARITTSEATDTVFLAVSPVKYAKGDVTFEGRAGAVRVSEDEVHLVISEGPASVSYRGTTLRSETPAVKVIAKAELAKKRTFEVPAPWKLKPTTLPEGCRIEGPARCELAVQSDRITGRREGGGGFLYAPMPPGMKVLPTLVIDGQTYAPGTSGDRLIIPLMPGEHVFEVRALEQPPVFSNWQARDK